MPTDGTNGGTAKNGALLDAGGRAPAFQLQTGSDAQAAPPEHTYASGELNALVHLYRAEVGRLTAFRTRLDTTTSWTVTSVTIVTTFGLMNADVPQSAFLFLMFAAFFFLHLEARRYRAYEASRYKVLLLERFFYPDLLGYGANPRWKDQLVEALRNPHLRVNYVGALGWRLRRTYLWLYLAILVIWLEKLHLKGPHTYDWDVLIDRAAIGALPGWGVLLLLAAGYVALISIAVGAHRIYPLGDDEAQEVLKATPED